ncbi:hypothetical protein KKD04_02285 [Patescibacteria group bacterium]|nr:hypothetical protein [Patescibacteria group bacterium]
MHSIFEAHIKNKEFDHGYLMSGGLEVSRELSFDAARVIFQGSPLEPKGDPWKLETQPDFFYKKYDLFGIDDAREIIYKASQTPLLGEKKVFIIESNIFSLEAANALLKTLEEPFSGTHFFIIVSSPDIIIPTLRSRLTPIKSNPESFFLEKEKKENCEKFLKSLAGRRLEMIGSISKDKQKTLDFLNDLEIFLFGKKSDMLILEEIEKAKNLFSNRASLPKMILEHLALTLPQM